jgi:hypothetical protein
MSRTANHHRESEGRRGSRIDFEEGGRYLGYPQNRAFSRSPSVQGTGCGTVRMGSMSGPGQREALGAQPIGDLRTAVGVLPVGRPLLELCQSASSVVLLGKAHR